MLRMPRPIPATDPIPGIGSDLQFLYWPGFAVAVSMGAWLTSPDDSLQARLAQIGAKAIYLRGKRLMIETGRREYHVGG
jgi:hypothetical protein